ncbi:MAG: MFS transporter [Chloroflexi bacterium]|nr:MFS transporter [Chloroflexota bacterium]
MNDPTATSGTENAITAQASPGGLRAFVIIWLGQLISLIGSQLTGFALGVWVYDLTHSVSLLALTQIAAQAPYVLFSPFAGVLADRWNRRTVMIISDLGAGLAVLAAAILFNTNQLQPWMVIPINFCMSLFSTLMWPAYTSAITVLIPKQHYGRANGFMQLGEALPQIAGPAIAGALYVAIRLGNMALIDAVTYLAAVSLMLLFVRIPNPQRTETGQQAKGSIWQEMKFGWNYIVARKGLFSLLMFFMATNFVSGVMNPLIMPLILDNWKADVFGYLSTIMGVGMLAGTLLMSAWGGGRNKTVTLLGASTLSALFLMAVGLRASIPLLAVCGFGFMFMMPLMNASSQAIWQAKVAPDVQGRVFAMRRTISWSLQLVAPLLAAPLADYVFRPAMAPGGALAPILGPLIGVGASRGVGLLISILGGLTLIISLVAFMTPAIRNVDRDIPDHV